MALWHLHYFLQHPDARVQELRLRLEFSGPYMDTARVEDMLVPIKLMAPVVRVVQTGRKRETHEALARSLEGIARPWLGYGTNSRYWLQVHDGLGSPKADRQVKQRHLERYMRFQAGEDQTKQEWLDGLQKRLLDPAVAVAGTDLTILFLSAALAGVVRHWDSMTVERDDCLHSLLFALKSRAQGLRSTPWNPVYELAWSYEIDEIFVEMGFWRLYEALHWEQRRGGYRPMKRDVRDKWGRTHVLDELEDGEAHTMWLGEKVRRWVERGTVEARLDVWPWDGDGDGDEDEDEDGDGEEWGGVLVP
jgi:hypothetical protein